jgi:hypothetical protein
MTATDNQEAASAGVAAAQSLIFTSALLCNWPTKSSELISTGAHEALFND